MKQGHPATEHAPHQTATRGGSQLVPPGIEPARRRKKGRADLTVRIPSRIQEAGHVTLTGRAKKLCTLLDLCVSSLRRGHANLLCIVPILTDDLRRGSNRRISNAFEIHRRAATFQRCGFAVWIVYAALVRRAPKCAAPFPGRNFISPDCRGRDLRISGHFHPHSGQPCFTGNSIPRKSGKGPPKIGGANYP